MRIATDELEALRSRLVAPINQSSGSEEPPILVASVLAGLVDSSAIRAAVALYDGGGDPTVWTVYAATEAALAYVEVAFDQQQYTAEIERDVPKYGGKYATADLRAAWVRPLSRIAEITVSGSSQFSDSGRWGVAAAVRFVDESEPVRLPDQRNIHQEDQWERAGRLLSEIRSRVGTGHQLER